MAYRRGQTQTFSMSFLDVISCGFGAVVLFFMVMSAKSGLARIDASSELNNESRRLEQEVIDGYSHLAELKSATASTETQKTRAVGLSQEILEKLRKTELELAAYEHDTVARREALERLKADLKALEEGNRRLKERALPSTTPLPRIEDRQQLRTLQVGGKHVLVLVDASASMLDETVVNIIRLRNMPPARRIASAKWQQAINTVEWVVARLPDNVQFQMYAYDTAPRPLVEGSAGRWLNASDAGQVELALGALRRTAPTGGSSLQNAVAVIGKLNPAPRNVILGTHRLP